VTFGSLFAGIGGLDLGLEQAGMTCRWQVENDEFCNRVLTKHWPAVARYGDIRRLAGSELEPVDLICGGFPCPPVSVAGKRKGTADERWIWPEFARIVRMVRPRYVLVENVPGLLSANHGGAMAEVLGDLANLGYDAEWFVLRASDFGASHRRARVFIVAYNQCPRREASRERCDLNPEREPKAGRGTVADSGDGQLQEPGTRPQGRDGAGPAGTILGHAPPGGRRILREPSGSARQPDGSGADVADSNKPGLEVGRIERGDVAEKRPAAEREGATVENTTRDDGRGCDGTQGRSGRGVCEAGSSLDYTNDGRYREPNEAIRTGRLPAFAHGPTDPRWPDLLVQHPELRPAISQAEAESGLRGMAHGLSNRTHRLRALGNAVVPAVAQWIGECIMETWRVSNGS